MPAMMIWPCAPMLNRPGPEGQGDAEAGGDQRRGDGQRFHQRGELPGNAGAARVEDRALEQRDVGAGGGGPDRGQEVGGPGKEVRGRGADLLVRAGDQQAAEDQGQQHGQDGDHAAAGEDPAHAGCPARPGCLPLWAVAGTAEGSMAPPAVSSGDDRGGLLGGAGLAVSAGVGACGVCVRSACLWLGCLSVMVASFGVEVRRRVRLRAVGELGAWCDGVRVARPRAKVPAIIRPRTSRPVPAGTMPTSLPL